MKNIWVPISGAIAQQRNVETIANNVANANTPGFKKDKLIFKEYLTALEKGHDQDINLPHKEWQPKDFYKSYGAENAYVKTDGSYTDFTQGQLTPTNNPFDLALNGPGFFEVLTPNGVRFTRRGIFTLSKDGHMVNDKGHILLSKFDWKKMKEKGDTNPYSPDNPPPPQMRQIQIDPHAQVMVNFQGEMFQKGVKVADISVVEFNDYHALKKQGNSTYTNANRKNILDTSDKTNIHQGFVEQSNVNAISEMSDLIKAHRQFESIQRVIKTYDTIAGKAVNEISRF